MRGFLLNRLSAILVLAVVLLCGCAPYDIDRTSLETAECTPMMLASLVSDVEHGGGLNSCGCHFNRKTGECHCHRSSGCGCSCQPPSCK